MDGEEEGKVRLEGLVGRHGSGKKVLIMKRVKSEEHACFWESGLFPSDEETVFFSWREGGLLCAVTARERVKKHMENETT